MKSDIIVIQGDVLEADIHNVLTQVEKVAVYQGLSEKQGLQLRLLAEELLGFEKGILGFSDGEMFIENNGDEYRICLHSDVKMDVFKKEQAVDLSTKQKNAAYKGFKGKLRMVVDTMFGAEGCSPTMMECCEILSSSYCSYSQSDYDQAWSMNTYKDDVKEHTEEWDMLEHSILANLADDVIVGARNNSLDIVIVKKFDSFKSKNFCEC